MSSSSSSSGGGGGSVADDGVMLAASAGRKRTQYIKTPLHWQVWQDQQDGVQFISPSARVTALFIPKASFEMGASLFGAFKSDVFSTNHRDVLSVLMDCATKLPQGLYQNRPELVVAVETMMHRDDPFNTVAGYLFTWASQAAPPSRRQGFRNRSDNEDNNEEAGPEKDDEDEKGKKTKRMPPRSMFEAFSRLITDLEAQTEKRHNQKRTKVSNEYEPAYRRLDRSSWCSWLGVVTGQSINPDFATFYKPNSEFQFMNASNPFDPANFLTLETALSAAHSHNVQHDQSQIIYYYHPDGEAAYRRPLPHLVHRLSMDQFREDNILLTFFPEIKPPTLVSFEPWQHKLVIRELASRGDIHPETLSRELARFNQYHLTPNSDFVPTLVSTTRDIEDMRRRQRQGMGATMSHANLQRSIREEAGRIFQRLWHLRGDLAPAQLECIRYLENMCRTQCNPCIHSAKITHDMSTFADMMTTSVIEVDTVFGIPTNHSYFIKALLSCMHIYLPGLHPHLLLLGEAGTGKSYVFDVLMKTLIPGTFMKNSWTPPKANSGGTRNDFRVIISDEVTHMLTGMDKSGPSSEKNPNTLAGRNAIRNSVCDSEQMGIMKDRMTSESTSVPMSTVIDGVRVDSITTTPTNFVYILAANAFVQIINGYIMDRISYCFYPTARNSQRDSRSIKNVLFTQKSESQRQREDLAISRIRRDQAIMNEIGAQIRSTRMSIDCTEALSFMNQVVELASEEGITNADQVRSIQRTVAYAQVLMIKHVIHDLFDSELSPFRRSRSDPSQVDATREFRKEELDFLQPYLRVTLEHAVFALTLNQVEFMPAVEPVIVKAIATVYFPPAARKECMDPSYGEPGFYYECTFDETSSSSSSSSCSSSSSVSRPVMGPVHRISADIVLDSEIKANMRNALDEKHGDTQTHISDYYGNRASSSSSSSSSSASSFAVPLPPLPSLPPSASSPNAPVQTNDMRLRHMAATLFASIPGDRPSIMHIVGYLGDLIDRRELPRNFRRDKQTLPVMRFTPKGTLLFAKSWLDPDKPRETVIIRAMKRVLQHRYCLPHTYLLGLPDPQNSMKWQTMRIEPQYTCDPAIAMTPAQFGELRRARLERKQSIRDDEKGLAVIREPNFVAHNIKDVIERQILLESKNGAIHSGPLLGEDLFPQNSFMLLKTDPELVYNSRFVKSLGIDDSYMIQHNLPSTIWHERNAHILAAFSTPGLPLEYGLATYDSLFSSVARHKVDPELFNAEEKGLSRTSSSDVANLAQVLPGFEEDVKGVPKVQEEKPEEEEEEVFSLDLAEATWQQEQERLLNDHQFEEMVKRASEWDYDDPKGEKNKKRKRIGGDSKQEIVEDSDEEQPPEEEEDEGEEAAVELE